MSYSFRGRTESAVQNARVVNRRITGTAGLLEIGFEFLQEFNFWGLNFPEEGDL
jgi:hypothetical protein